MTSQAFLIRYPEFETLDPDFVSAVLTEVGFGLDSSVYGLRFDAAQGALAAHKIWLSPAGSPLRGESDQAGISDYLKTFEQIRREVTMGFMVVT